MPLGRKAVAGCRPGVLKKITTKGTKAPFGCNKGHEGRLAWRYLSLRVLLFYFFVSFVEIS